MKHKLVSLVNWHWRGRCLFPALCLYDEILLNPGVAGKATWREARRLRREIDRTLRRLAWLQDNEKEENG